MRFVDKLSVAYARAELLSTLRVQTRPEQSHPLPASHSTAAELAQHRPALPPAPACHSVPKAAEEVLTPATCSCQCSSTSTEGRTFFIHPAASWHQDAGTGGHPLCLASVIEEGQARRRASLLATH